MKTLKYAVKRLAKGLVVVLHGPETPVSLPVWLLWLL